MKVQERMTNTKYIYIKNDPQKRHHLGRSVKLFVLESFDLFHGTNLTKPFI